MPKIAILHFFYQMRYVYQKYLPCSWGRHRRRRVLIPVIYFINLLQGPGSTRQANVECWYLKYFRSTEGWPGVSPGSIYFSYFFMVWPYQKYNPRSWGLPRVDPVSTPWDRSRGRSRRTWSADTCNILDRPIFYNFWCQIPISKAWSMSIKKKYFSIRTKCLFR